MIQWIKRLSLSSILLLVLLTLQGQTDDSINWYSLEEATALSETEPKKIFIDVMTVWCGWCKKMDREVFTNEQVISEINKNYYAVKLDAQQKEDLKFNDQTFKYKMYGKKGFNEFAVELLRGRMGFPSLVFLDEEQKVIQALEGYQESGRLALILTYIGEDEYKRIPWSNFVRQFEMDRLSDKINLNSIQNVNKKKN